MFKKITAIVVENESDIIRQKEIEYGLYCLFLLVINFVGLFLLALLFSVLPHLLIVLFGVGTLRIFSGGRHAKTPAICFITTAIFYFFIIGFALYFPLKMPILTLFFIVSLFLILKFAPADTPQKLIGNIKHRQHLKYLSLLWLSACYIVAIFLQPNIATMIIMGNFIQSLTIIPTQKEVKK